MNSISLLVYVMQSLSTMCLNSICPADMRDWSKVTMEIDPCVGLIRRVLSDLMDKIKGEVNRLSKSGQ